MPTVKFDISEAEEVARHLGFSIDKAAKRAVLSLALRIVQHITTYVIPRENPQPVDRGAFRAGWRAKRDPDGATVKNTLPYAAVIEYGARAENVKVGKAMIDALTAWVLRKGIGLTRNPPSRPLTKKQMKFAREWQARKVAWAIAMGMLKKGIFNREDERGGLRVLEKALKISKHAFADELRREIEREYR
jgi:hypothetical protein